MTAGQRWRSRRAMVITTAAAAGFSDRFLADVFDLARSRIAAIVRETHHQAEALGRRPTRDRFPSPARPTRRGKP